MQAKTFDLSLLNGGNGFFVSGIVQNGVLGYSVNTAGDINGDGISDLILGAPGENSSSGVSYVIFGSRTGFPASFDLTALNGSNGFSILGVVFGGFLGASVSSTGDINSDGFSDLVLGAYGANSRFGDSYVLFGSQRGFPASFDLTALNGSNGFTIPGIAVNGQLGYSVSSAGDINGDGFSDLVLGAYGANSNLGASYVIFGSRSSFPAVFDLANLNGSNGFTIPGIVGAGYLGFSASSAGDINGDNITDLVLGAPYANSFAQGASYVLFGGLASITLTKNALTIIEGQTVLLNNSNLNAVGIISFDTLIFVVSSIQGGRFTFVSNSSVAIFNFTQTQLSNNQIQFISDRTNLVAYQVGMANMTSGQLVFTPIPANVNFTNYPPVVVNQPNAQLVDVGIVFNFAFSADRIFNDPDGDPLNYTAQLSNGSALPNWLQFDSSQANQLAFSGTTPVLGSTHVSLLAKDPLNASVSTKFDIIAALNNVTNVNGVSTTQIAGSVVGGIVGLGALIGAGLGFWRYAANKNTRKGESFADAIRASLNLKGVDDFDSERGQKYVAAVHTLQSALQQAGIDPASMRLLELRQLAGDVAEAARNKISSATDCLGRSVITVTDLNDNLQNLVAEVQVLRAGGKQNTI